MRKLRIKDYQNFFSVATRTAERLYAKDLIELKRHPAKRLNICHGRVTDRGFEKLYGIKIEI